MEEERREKIIQHIEYITNKAIDGLCELINQNNAENNLKYIKEYTETIDNLVRLEYDLQDDWEDDWFSRYYDDEE